jgi:competence ComEA-like helix-hairpin-helix protein
MNYRKAGGFFDKKEDLKKIYGIDEAFYKRIKHLIQIKKRETQLEVKSDKKENSKTVKTPVESSKLLVGKRKVNLNSADTIELMLIHGIGRAYANRIVKYREMLGGYIKIEQLNEVYGINDSIYQSINGSFYLNNSDDTDLIKININKADFKQLIRHPYINQYQTKSILKYREIKGRIEQIEELVEYNILPEKTYNKLKGYLTCD